MGKAAPLNSIMDSTRVFSFLYRQPHRLDVFAVLSGVRTGQGKILGVKVDEIVATTQ